MDSTLQPIKEDKMNASRNLKSYVLIILCMAMTGHTFAGAGSSGGGDRYKVDFEAAWFIGDLPINYCIEMADDFPVGKEKALSTIQAVISQWKDYVARKDIEENATIKLNFNYHYTERCSSQTELTFYLGIETPRVRKAKTNFSNPWAFARKESYDFKSGLGRGLVWIKTNPIPNVGNLHPWERNNSFYGILLHEFGHILGVPHVPGTIMDDRITKWLFVKEKNLSRNKKIDQVVELAPAMSSSTKEVGVPAMSYKRSKEIFTFLTGKKSVGNIESIFEANSKGAKVTLKDQVGSYSFKINSEDQDSWSMSYPVFEIFKKAYPDYSKSKIQYKKTSHPAGNRSASFIGKLTTPQGIPFTFLFEYNLAKVPKKGDLEDENGNVSPQNPDLNLDPKYANIPYEIYIIKDHKKVRIFGPSAYGVWWGFPLPNVVRQGQGRASRSKSQRQAQGQG